MDTSETALVRRQRRQSALSSSARSATAYSYARASGQSHCQLLANIAMGLSRARFRPEWDGLNVVSAVRPGFEGWLTALRQQLAELSFHGRRFHPGKCL